MVIRAQLDAMTVSRIRWSPSPALEAVSWMAQAASGRPHPLWGDPGPAARMALRDRDVAVTATLARGGLIGRYMPDFLTPKPDHSAATDSTRQLDWQLEVIRGTDAEMVHDQLNRLAGSGMSGRSDAADLPRVVANALFTFWRQAMAERWSAMRAQLLQQQENQVREAAYAGINGVLNTLHPSLRWQDDQLEVDKPYDEETAFHDAELVLVPSLMVWPRLVVQLCDPANAMLAFPVAGRDGRAVRPADALLGRGRSRVLRHIGAAASTTDLSRALGMAPSTVSHHLGVLLSAGLVSRQRSGRAVLYRRTEAGQRLLDAAASTTGLSRAR
jgi:DNA-binding transcriptional ArsR family regulator